MSKELPYFRFTAMMWIGGEIYLEKLEIKGFFIDLCAHYWHNECSITIAMIKKRFGNDRMFLLESLIVSKIVKKEPDSEYIQITFLNEQWDILSKSRKSRQIAGAAGGRAKHSNAVAMLKQCNSYKDKDKDKDKDKINILSENSNPEEKSGTTQEGLNTFVENTKDAPQSPINPEAGEAQATSPGVAGKVARIKPPAWKTDFSEYQKQENEGYLLLIGNPSWMEKQERLKKYPNLNIKKSMEKAHEFWQSEPAWKHKKSKKTIDINWSTTFSTALTFSSNQVFDERNTKQKAPDDRWDFMKDEK